MHNVIQLKIARKANLTQHEFYRWVRSSKVPIEERLLFAPIMANFVMAFRDANKWFIRFPQPQTEFERVINGSTFEDETHSRLFLEEWQKLELDKKLAWKASDTLYWLYFAPETEPFRKYVLEMASLSVLDGGDPLVRFAHTEAGEACGHAFFSVLAPIAEEIHQKTGITHRYFGVHHLDKEPGHVLHSEGVFDHETLDEHQQARALSLANRMFDVFEAIHDCFLQYAQEYVENRRFPSRSKPIPSKRRPDIEPHANAKAKGGPMDETHTYVAVHLQTRKERAAQHPFYTWLRDDESLSAKHKLMRTIPLWIVDILGYRELNAYTIRYPNAQTPEEQAVNAICDDLETHSALFLADWDALGLDEALGWNASQTLAFCFLDKNVDTHRKNLATFVKLAVANEHPALRLWLLEALEASGHAFFENTRRLATRVEQDEGIRLDYLADRHELAHQPQNTQANTPEIILRKPLTQAEQTTALEIVNAVFDALEEQLTVSLMATRTNAVGIR